MPALFILIPLLSLMLLNLPFGLMRRLIYGWGILLCLAQFFSVIYLPLGLWGRDLGVLAPFFKLDLGVDNFTRLMLICIGIVSFTAIFLVRYLILEEGKRFNFLSLLFLALIGLNGVVLVEDIFSLYVFLEVVTVCSFIIIAFSRRPDALEGAFKYVILSGIGSMMLLAAIALIFIFSGSTNFIELSAAVKALPHNWLMNFALALFLSGLLIKSGMVPFHGWLADAYTAAGPVGSIFLAGIITKTVGIYALMRVVIAVFGFSAGLIQVLLFVGALSIVVGALLALAQDDFKRMLAYSSISQVGYILLGFGCGSAFGFIAACFHLFNHAIFKSLLFVNSAALEQSTGSRDMRSMGGLAQKMPFTGITSIIGALSAAGLPPLAGFWSKLLIILALWFSGHFLYAAIAVIASLLTLSYMLSMQRKVFFGELAIGMENIREARFGLLFPAILLALIIVLIGVSAPFWIKL